MSAAAQLAPSPGRPKRVLYIFANGSLGGAEKITWLMLKHHDPRRYQAVALFLAPGPLPALVAESTRTLIFSERLRLSRPWTVARASRFVAQALLEERIDLIHTCLPYSHLVAAGAAQQRRTPILLFQHGPVGGWVDRLASALPTDLILTNSAYTQGRVEERNFRRWPTALLPLATELVLTPSEESKHRAAINHKHGLNEQDFVVTILARLAPGKGLDFAITALAQLLRARPELRLLLIGGPFRHFFPSYRAELEQLIEREGLQSQVLLVGFQDDIKPYLARADVVLSASFEEAFGLTLIEGMAAGKAVVSSRVGGAAEVMTDGVEGRYFTSGDAEGLRSCLGSLLADPAARAAMGAAGRRRVAADYAPDVLRLRLEAYYDGILQQRRAAP